MVDATDRIKISYNVQRLFIHYCFFCSIYTYILLLSLNFSSIEELTTYLNIKKAFHILVGKSINVDSRRDAELVNNNTIQTS